MLPEDVVTYIKSFLVKCECCQKHFTNSYTLVCSLCHRGWCHDCLEDWSYITYKHCNLSIPICKHCNSYYRRPHFCNSNDI